jgi:formylmethanofuran dehydrogenase subunit E
MFYSDTPIADYDAYIARHDALNVECDFCNTFQPREDAVCGNGAICCGECYDKHDCKDACALCAKLRGK